MKKRDHILRAMRNHRMILLVVIFLVLIGFVCLPFMKKDEFPQMSIYQGVIVALYPGATAEEVEEQVTKPLERYLFTHEELDKEQTYSITKDGVCYIYGLMRFEIKNTDAAWQRIRAGVDLFKQTSLPAGVLGVVVIDDFGQTSSILLAIESTERSPRELEYYTQKLCDNLRALPTLGNIRVSGTQQEEIAVELDLDRLAQYGLNQTTLLAQLKLQGFRTLGATVNNNNQITMVQTSIPYASEYELGEQVIYYESVTGASVRLKDIATITRRYKPDDKSVIYYEDSLRASSVIVSIEMMPNNNIVKFGMDVQKILDDTQAQLPADIHLHRITDQPKIVYKSIVTFLRDLVLSMLIVILVMLFLFPLRTALVSSTGVPVCIAVAVCLMYMCGIALNTVTLAALIVVLGMIVDDSVIVIDGYTELLDKGHSRWYAAHHSTKALFIPMALATCSISGMFFPMTKIITGPLGEFVQYFPWTVLFALTASIFYAVWVIPYLSTRYIKHRDIQHINWFERGQNRFFAFLQNGYKKVLTLCFRFPKTTIAIAVLFVLLGAWIFTRSNIQMLPKADREIFAVEIRLSEGSDITQTTAIADSLATLLLQDKRVESITSFIGQSSPRFHMTYSPQIASESYAQFIVNATSQKATRNLVKEYGQIYSDYFPNAYIRFKRMDYQSVRNPIEVHITGDDLELQRQWADSVKVIFARHPKMMWIHSNADEQSPTIRVQLKPDEASQLGITQTQLSVYLSSVLGGQKLTTIWEQDYPIPVMLYTAGADHKTAEELGDILIPTLAPTVWIPLRQVADIQPDWHLAEIEHRNNLRTVTVGADLAAGTLATKELRKLQKEIAQEIEPNLPAGLSISYGGLQAVNERVIPQLIWSVIAALIVMLVFMVYHFGKLSVAFLSLAQSMLCIFGTCIGLKIFNLDFSITALLGMVSLIGIIIRNAIIMYEYAEKLVKSGMPVKQAAFEAGLRRMRPIFLTSTTTALGVVPLIIAHTGLWMPMGAVICFGTIITLPFVITVLPVTYWKFVGQRRIKY